MLPLRRVVAGSLTALAVGLAGGCGGAGDKPAAAPSLGPPASSPPATSTAASSPAATYPATAAGAEAFIRRYFDVLNTAQLTGNVLELKQMSADSCTSCINFVRSLEAVYRSGSREVDAHFNIKGVAIAQVNGGQATATVIYDSPPAQIVDESGRVLRQAAAEMNVDATVRLARDDGSWRMAELTKEKM